LASAASDQKEVL